MYKIAQLQNAVLDIFSTTSPWIALPTASKLDWRTTLSLSLGTV